MQATLLKPLYGNFEPVSGHAYPPDRWDKSGKFLPRAGDPVIGEPAELEELCRRGLAYRQNHGLVERIRATLPTNVVERIPARKRATGKRGKE